MTIQTDSFKNLEPATLKRHVLAVIASMFDLLGYLKQSNNENASILETTLEPK